MENFNGDSVLEIPHYPQAKNVYVTIKFDILECDIHYKPGVSIKKGKH